MSLRYYRNLITASQRACRLASSQRPLFSSIPIHCILPRLQPRAISTMTTSSFADTVVSAMRTLFPEVLADKAWDNTGLLLGQAQLSATKDDTPGTVLLTNDLTAAVVDEAIREKASIIVSYHPVIFRALKSLTAQDPMQAQLLRLIASGIAVYCPHTAVDAANGGLNDWLCDILVGDQPDLVAGRSVIEPITRTLPSELQGLGYGRKVQLNKPTSLAVLLKNLSAGLGNQRYMSVAVPQDSVADVNRTQSISSVAVCAGSGADMLKDSDAQLLVTGEMSHHYALRHVQLGQTVVTVFHSNSERQYLTQRMKPMLEKALGSSGKVIVSTTDRDPFEVIDVSKLA
ncbi:GTP cyclohydrolase 1 type 2/Nif3 [Pseudomassariella vexata]|uniref:GTP cyclohydrolase 1 type 2/Nif3 n=1 Tax=Pseudomassariella vexata TaxID=1141098 RepID=A0A1Y2DHY2_9PEZI|nr:GTP cyclohydrolase 1 type 2/Nif3 [Pseudomassariella vexata]ORY58852.1 GTP cyclohydrolase 1 type 2/Nif3 [Pseudomassariella vexata]